MTQFPEKINLTPPANKNTTGRKGFTVSQLTAKIKGVLEMEVAEVWVKGELSSFKPSTSGHWYFSLKDNDAVISCALFRGHQNKLKFTPKDGLTVWVHGRISVFAPRGSYQLLIDYMEPEGQGALLQELEKLKQKLYEEGLFDTARKKKIPEFPQKIAIITAPTGAAIRDILQILGRRNAGIEVLVVPSLVQGEAAVFELIKGLEVVNDHKLAEVIILARGGGSVEDLWCFNDENLVRAIAASSIPVISAVGHEIDYTLVDFVSDLRAPTPSAAAELISKNRLELIETIQHQKMRLNQAFFLKLKEWKTTVLSLEKRLISPSQKLLETRKLISEYLLRLEHSVANLFPHRYQILDEFLVRMKHATEKRILRERKDLEGISCRLEAISPLKVLGRGYTLIKDNATQELVKSAKQTEKIKKITVVFHDGQKTAEFI